MSACTIGTTTAELLAVSCGCQVQLVPAVPEEVRILFLVRCGAQGPLFLTFLEVSFRG